MQLRNKIKICKNGDIRHTSKESDQFLFDRFKQQANQESSWPLTVRISWKSLLKYNFNSNELISPAKQTGRKFNNRSELNQLNRLTEQSCPTGEFETIFEALMEKRHYNFKSN